MAEEITKQQNTTQTKKSAKKDYVDAVGRRKEAVARVRLYERLKDGFSWDGTEVKKGELYINKKPIFEYFPSKTMRFVYSEPLRATNTQNKYTWTISVSGGGVSGQLEAVVAGIANALNALDKDKHRPVLKKRGFLTRDARVRQRRKVGMGGKSRREKQSPKR